jgi:UDP-3-O-[3-hydroxymyristoyl] glucosamine N-acyltransferase
MSQVTIAYGMTETSPVSTQSSVDDPLERRVSTVGRVEPHIEIKIVDSDGRIVPRGVTGGPEGTALIAVDNPTFAFSTVVRHFAAASRAFTPGVSPQAFVDPSAVLDPAKTRVHPGAAIMAGAIVGDGCEIGPNSVIGENAVIGRDCQLMANTTVRERCVLGDRVILQPGAVIGSDGYGYELVDGRHVKIDQVGIVEIHDDVEIGANTTIDRGALDDTVIGDGVKLDNLIQVGHNVHIGAHTIIAGCVGISGSARIGAHCRIGGAAGIAVSGAGAVSQNVILTKTNAAIDNSSVNSAGDVDVYATSPSRIVAEIAGISAAGAAGGNQGGAASVGAAVARNYIGWDRDIDHSSDNTALFSTQPAIGPAGVLTFAPADEAHGATGEDPAIALEVGTPGLFVDVVRQDLLHVDRGRMHRIHQ